MDFLKEFFGSSSVQVIYLAYDTVEWWAPIVLGITAVRTWIYYVRSNFIRKKKKVLLEIRIPRDTFKSPLAMETALSGFHQTSRESNWYKKYIKGGSRPWFSLEMVSIEGKVRFFIWTEVDYVSIVEASIYAHYPTVEIFEVPDYTGHVPYGLANNWTLYGTEFGLVKPDPYPIKTYVDYNLDQDPKEEFKIDPLTQVLEFLGSLKKDEQVWIQILIRATKETNKRAGGLFGKPQDWKREGAELVKKLREEYGKQDPKPGQTFAFDKPLTKGQTEEISAIERSVAKLGFDTGIRAIYLAKSESFRNVNISAMLGVLRQFNSNILNGFKGGLNVTDFDYPWEDFQGIRLAWRKAAIWNAYVRRSYFHPPYKRKWFVLNQEELATIFHFPGRVAETPTFERIDSKKAEPPANLPI